MLGRPCGWDSALSLPRPQVQSLVRELRSPAGSRVQSKKQKQKKQKQKKHSSIRLSTARVRYTGGTQVSAGIKALAAERKSQQAGSRHPGQES